MLNVEADQQEAIVDTILNDSFIISASDLEMKLNERLSTELLSGSYSGGILVVHPLYVNGRGIEWQCIGNREKLGFFRNG